MCDGDLNIVRKHRHLYIPGIQCYLSQSQEITDDDLLGELLVILRTASDNLSNMGLTAFLDKNCEWTTYWSSFSRWRAPPPTMSYHKSMYSPQKGY